MHIRGKYAESITPYHLLYGRGVSGKNTLINYFIEVSELSNICKQLANLQQMNHFNKILYNEYILALREQHPYDSQSHPVQNVSIRDIVLEKVVDLPALLEKRTYCKTNQRERKPCPRSNFRHCCIKYK